MLIDRLAALLAAQFPNAALPTANPALAVGAVPEWDSLAHFNLLLAVEEEFGIRFSVDQMAELKSLGDIAAALATLGVPA